MSGQPSPASAEQHLSSEGRRRTSGIPRNLAGEQLIERALDVINRTRGLSKYYQSSLPTL
jgi:hypothetical protein